MNRKAKARLAARKKASRPDRFIEDGYSHWKFSKGKSTSASSDSAPVAHSDPTLVADFDPSQTRDKGGKWAKDGGSGGDGGGGGFPRKTLAGISDKFRGEVLDYVKRQGWDEKEFEHRLDHEVHRHKNALAARSAQESSTHEQVVKDVMGQVMSQMRAEARQKDAEDFKKLRAEKLAQPVPAPPGMGASTAQVQILSKRTPAQVEEHLKKVLGEHGTMQDVASLAGAAHGAVVTVSPGKGASSLTVRVKHPDYVSKRTIYKDENGNLVLHNDEFFMKPGSTGKGLGAEVFGRQVEHAQRLGVSRIETLAGGPPAMNGYYTWPRFGYDQHLDSLALMSGRYGDQKIRAAREKFPGVESVSDIFLHSGGAEWWKTNGLAMPEATFDLKQGSRSLKVWHGYLAEKAASRPRSEPVSHSSQLAEDIALMVNVNPRYDPLDHEVDDIGNGEENYDFSPEVEYALDAAWEKLGEELGGKSPVAHFDPSQTRDTHGRWSPSGKANAFDYVLKRGTESNQTMRDFYKSVHEDVSTTRPAGDSRFHDPLRLHIEKQLHELAGDHGEALYRTGKAGMTQIAFKNHEVNVVTEAPGRITVFSKHLHGPDPRDPRSFTITHETPHEEVAYRLHKAAGLKVDKGLEAKYKAADKATRDQFRAHHKAVKETQEKAREARRSSTQNLDISAEEISQLVSSGEVPVVHFDPSQARDSHGKWTKGAVESARAKAHDYIRENGPTSHDELAYHLVDEGIVDRHADGVSLVHHLVDAGHLVAGSDEHGGDVLHVPSGHDAVESWKPAADTQAIIQRAHIASTAADRASSTATDATSHRRAAEAHASAVMVVGDAAERLRSEKAPESEVTRYGDLKSYHAQMEARHRSQSVGWPAKGLAPVNPEAARAARVPTSPKEHPVSKGTSTAAIPTHTAADLDRMSIQQMRQLAIKLGVRGARSKGARSLREELLVRAVPESSGGLVGHSLSAEDISVLINSGELDVNAICRDWHGRFARCGSEGITPSERDVISTDRMAHARHLVEQVRGGQASNPAAVKALTDHLGTLTVAQLHSLKKEYGLKASGKNKAVLKEKLTARFSQKAAMVSTPTTGTPKASETTPAPSPPLPTPVHVPVGTFGTTKGITWKHADHEAHAHELAHQILGPNATAHDLVSVAGIPDGARVEVATLDGGIAGKHAYVEGTGTVQIKNPDTGEMEHNRYTAARTISLHPDGTRDIHNDSFEGKGSGLQMFGRQVENATKWGFTHIDTYAAGHGHGTTGERPPKGAYNGYYTWPRFGYNGKVYHEDIALMPPDVQRNANAAGGMISGVMSTKEGRDWWLGHGDSLNLKFDLTPGSYSQDTLHTYLKHRGVLK